MGLEINILGTKSTFSCDIMRRANTTKIWTEKQLNGAYFCIALQFLFSKMGYCVKLSSTRCVLGPVNVGKTSNK